MAVSADRTRCISLLDKLLTGSEGLNAALLALRDGRPFAERVRHGVDAGRFAAMASSLTALGRSVLGELRLGETDHLLIEGSAGKIVLCSVPDSGRLLLLAVVASQEARLGLVLGQARICAEAVAATIRKG